MKNWLLIIVGLLAGCHASAPIIPGYTITIEQRYSKKAMDAQNYPHLHDFSAIKEQQHRPVVALVLGSGGARGYAHIGAIEVLEKNGIRPDFIVGTSAGSIVGALYASGKSVEEIKYIASNMKVQDVRGFKLNKQGFLDGEKVEEFVNTQVYQQPLENLKIPLYIVATTLKTGQKMIFNYGNTGQAVRASVAIPSMFVPTEINHVQYVDGGLVSPVPVDVAKKLGADVIIAVDILAQPQYTETENMWGMFNQNINIMQQHLSQIELSEADVVIRPELKEKSHIFDVKERDNTRIAGFNATEQKIAMIKRVIEVKTNELALHTQKPDFS